MRGDLGGGGRGRKNQKKKKDCLLNVPKNIEKKKRNFLLDCDSESDKVFINTNS